MGGEKPNRILWDNFKQGSPPHGRGKGPPPRYSGTCTGITPAWAGKRQRYSSELQSVEDHPRMGGEKRVRNEQIPLADGSPPHGRGKVSMAFLIMYLHGITPAWAGKSRWCARGLTRAQDHPRMGGEKHQMKEIQRKSEGSPPHGRGKGVPPRLAVLHPGITPAWAGKRLKRSHRSGIFISGPIPFHSALHRPAGSGGSRAGRDGSPAGQPQNAGPA